MFWAEWVARGTFGPLTGVGLVFRPSHPSPTFPRRQRAAARAAPRPPHESREGRGAQAKAIGRVSEIPQKRARTEEADAISRTLNDAARQANTHVLLACHLNQERNKGGAPPAPVRRDIRETGSFANDAANVMFVHRDSEPLTTISGEQTGRFEILSTGRIYFDKVRNGLMSGTDVSLDPVRMRFVEV